MAPVETQPVSRGPLPDEVLPSLVRFAELLTPDIFREQVDRDGAPLFPKAKLERTQPARPVAELKPLSEPIKAPPAFIAPLSARSIPPFALPPVIEAKTATNETMPPPSLIPNPVEPVLPATTPLALDPARPKLDRRPFARQALRVAATILFMAAGASSMGGLSVRSVGLLPPPATASLAMPLELETNAAPMAPPVDQLHWWTLREAFDRIGFDLDSVASGSAPVPRVALVMLPSDLDGIDDLDARKDLFLRAFLPVVLAVNEHILDERKRLSTLRAKITSGGTLEGSEVQWLLAEADKYDQPDLDFEALLKKVDAIPPSLALAQAIEESGWGTSRIAKGQNAMFGQFGEDPLGGWDYRSYDSLTAAVESYARNLNTHRAYREFRQARSTMRSHGGSMDAFALASTLFRYSERGPLYVKNLRWIMRDNDLRAFDSAHLDVGERVAVIASNDDARDFELPRP